MRCNSGFIYAWNANTIWIITNNGAWPGWLTGRQWMHRDRQREREKAGLSVPLRYVKCEYENPAYNWLLAVSLFPPRGCQNCIVANERETQLSITWPIFTLHYWTNIKPTFQLSHKPKSKRKFNCKPMGNLWATDEPKQLCARGKVTCVKWPDANDFGRG